MFLLPAAMMFVLTVGFVSAFLLPATYERKSALVNFYWVGTWLFLAILAAISGAEQTVRLVGLDQSDFAQRLKTAALVCFPLFIVFAWMRLAGAAAMLGVKRVLVRN